MFFFLPNILPLLISWLYLLYTSTLAVCPSHSPAPWWHQWGRRTRRRWFAVRSRSCVECRKWVNARGSEDTPLSPVAALHWLTVHCLRRPPCAFFGCLLSLLYYISRNLVLEARAWWWWQTDCEWTKRYAVRPKWFLRLLLVKAAHWFKSRRLDWRRKPIVSGKRREESVFWWSWKLSKCLNGRSTAWGSRAAAQTDFCLRESEERQSVYEMGWCK